ncbi:MAG: hypothetical protein PHP74_03065, partial [Candidatus Gracilibacteria bacterium]|nr:hypothetical protein [Candidatus Gracilibacteria bacterium]
ITAGVPEIKFTHSAEFEKAHRASNEFNAALDSEAPEAGDLSSRKAELQKDPLIQMLVSMSGDDAILDKILKKEPASFFGFLISIIAGIKGIAGFEDSWATVKAYAPKELHPFLGSVEETVLGSDDKIAEFSGLENDKIIELINKESAHEVKFATGLTFKEAFTPSESYAYLEVELPDGSTINFGEEGEIGAIKEVNAKKVETDFTVSDSKILKEGTYRIYGSIPAKTKFSKGSKLRLVKQNSTPSTVADKPSSGAESKPDAVAPETNIGIKTDVVASGTNTGVKTDAVASGSKPVVDVQPEAAVPQTKPEESIVADTSS